ncbi:sigma-70 family RNA polymerase sigma factor [candidate division WOR-3 bacterium]|nr:sigma-70 family RNA polymerase sigma factor [candidate division WOR-3 bacterium]
MSRTGRNRSDVTDAIRRVLDGDVEAYEIIYRECNGSLRSFIGSWYGQHGNDFVDEVAIRTHERALTKLPEFDPGRASFQTWLNWQARSVASQVLAEWRGPRFTGFDEDLHAQYVPSVPGPEELHERRRRDELVRQEFEALDEEGRLTMFYHDLTEMTFSATATEMGCSVGRVRRTRDKALAQMRRQLDKRGISASTLVPVHEPAWPVRPRPSSDDNSEASPVAADLPDGPGDSSDAAAVNREEVREDE